MKPGAEKRSSRPVAIWLLIGVFMIIVQVILGGITRLTDSGLSITEWKPILGTLPPMNEKAWAAAFEKYKQIAQFKQLHSYFTLEDFKSIYFWEWLHRNWGKLIGVVFAVPFLVFIKQRRFNPSMIKPLIILFLLGGLQGLVGWIMVQSGLNEENLYVSHIRLAIHFIMALLLLVYTFWFALQLLVPGEKLKAAVGYRKMIIAITVLLFFQLIYGAFMAGLKAATSAPTWPSINGEYFPANMGSYAGKAHSFFSALVYDPITIHFIHRNLAYLIFILVLVWSLRAIKLNARSFFNRVKWLPLLLVSVQLLLGIAAVLTSPGKVPQQWGDFEWSAQLHQFVAILLLLSLVLVLYLLPPQENPNSRAKA
jgi:cytochrome c oxidase assembly protein subunit 15